ncbi:MAG: hypothetical protein RQ736_06195 [Thiogranum sp.]|nr:hypothetical protein [Thiogranum sp.]
MAQSLLEESELVGQDSMYRLLLLSLVFLCAVSIGAETDAETAVDAFGFVEFNRLDSDNNGYVSRVEARSVGSVERVFATADLNRDGLLDRREYERVRSALHARQ